MEWLAASTTAPNWQWLLIVIFCVALFIAADMMMGYARKQLQKPIASYEEAQALYEKILK